MKKGTIVLTMLISTISLQILLPAQIIRHDENTFADKVITSNSLIRESPFELSVMIAGILSGCMAVMVALLLNIKYKQPLIGYYAALISASTASIAIVFVQWVIVALSGGVFADLGVWGVALYVIGLSCLGSLCYTFGFFFLALVDKKAGTGMRVILAVPLMGTFVTALMCMLGAPQPFSLLNLMFMLMEIWFAVEVASLAAMLIVVRKTIKNPSIKHGLSAAIAVSGLFLPIWLLELSGVLQTHLVFLFFPVWNIVTLVIAAVKFFKPESTTGPLIEHTMVKRFAVTYGLTPREAEIIELFAEGSSYVTIADKLCISGKTVRNHIANIYGKSAVGNRMQLINLMRQV